MNRILRPLLLLTFVISMARPAAAYEGMWIPMLLAQLNESDMQSNGLKLTAEDIYSVNNSSLKDAIVHFGGGCTGEIISDKGLLLTNHHCGYGQIQSHSSLKNDYLKDGFWAQTLEDELSNPGLTATFIIRMEDVTEAVLKGLSVSDTGVARQKTIAANIAGIREKAVEGTHYEAMIKPFFHGNQYYMFITETFKDVRLVGAPPSSIGKFGFDTDNWVWPRHTGDFSVFRVYAGPDNKPAEYSKDNVPFKPRHHLPINMQGADEGDFTMIYGFPGSTSEYLTSYAVDHILNKSNPARINMRKTGLEVIDKAMRANDKVRIQYASKQSRISNAYKKWIGQNKGLVRYRAVEMKRKNEILFQARVEQKKEWRKPYNWIIKDYRTNYKELEPYALARDYFIEFVYYGPELIRYANRYKRLVTLVEEEEDPEKIQNYLKQLKETSRGFFKNFDLATEKELFSALVPVYLNGIDPYFHPPSLDPLKDRYSQNMTGFTEMLYGQTMFANQQGMNEMLNNFDPKMVKKIKKDPMYVLMDEIYSSYFDRTRPTYQKINNRFVDLDRIYMKALMEVMPKDNYYPDANSTLRLAYGKVEGYEPQDGIVYSPFTSVSGILEKYEPGSYEFDVPKKLVELIENKDFGPYGSNGDLRVCFIASNHTSGGNSGSPALDGEGRLIGLNFDRTWESTMSDIVFDPTICRNIMVDIRYVLFIMDKFAGADRLIQELTLVNAPEGN